MYVVSMYVVWVCMGVPPRENHGISVYLGDWRGGKIQRGIKNRRERLIGKARASIGTKILCLLLW